MYTAMRPARPKIRLYVPVPFHAGHHLDLSENQSHYLAQVMRLGEGDSVAVGAALEYRAREGLIGTDRRAGRGGDRVVAGG